MYFLGRTQCLIAVFLLSTMQPSAEAGSLSGLDLRPENSTCIAPQRPVSADEFVFEKIISGLDNFAATDIRLMPGTASIYAITSRAGRIDLYQDGDPSIDSGNFKKLGEYLDIDDQVEQEFNGKPTSEMGLLGIVFHPDFQNNGYVYVYYSALGTQLGSDYESRLSRFTSEPGSLTLNRETEEVLLRVDHSVKLNHWGGSLFFDNTGFLYLTLGDASDPYKAPDPYEITGKVLRLDVDSNFPYGIPEDNPYVNGGGLPEVYASGFRNPWRASFDSETGVIWLGDVGHIGWEEINQVSSGGNFGWPILEGNHCGPWQETEVCEVANSIPPVAEHSHEEGFSAILGGFVYRGAEIPELYGKYIYSDVGTGGIWVLDEDESGQFTPRLVSNTAAGYTFSLAQDEHNEILALTRHSVLKLTRNTLFTDDSFPHLLSKTGCVNPENPVEAATGVLPYDVNSPLWSDGAAKQRWMALPDWKETPPKIEVDNEGDWDLPIGTVLMKSFSLDNILVESRLLVRHEDGGWAGYSYEWKDDQSDAILLDTSKTITIGSSQWTFPDRAQCLQCHTAIAGGSLGLETAQLNRDNYYAGTDRTANQIATFNHLELFSEDLGSASQELPALAVPQDKNSQTLGRRARSYMHANCSMCHQPEGPGQGQLDLRYFVDDNSTGLINASPFQTDFGIAGAKLVSPGNPDNSVLLHRVRTLEEFRMPPLSSEIEDLIGTELIEDWIRSYSDLEVESETSRPAASDETNRANEISAATAEPQLSIGMLDPWTLLLTLFMYFLYRARCLSTLLKAQITHRLAPSDEVRNSPSSLISAR